MTNHTAIPVHDSAAAGAENIARKAGEMAFIVVVAAALAAAWLVLFTFLPLDFSTLRPH